MRERVAQLGVGEQAAAAEHAVRDAGGEQRAGQRGGQPAGAEQHRELAGGACRPRMRAAHQAATARASCVLVGERAAGDRARRAGSASTAASGGGRG